MNQPNHRPMPANRATWRNTSKATAVPADGWCGRQYAVATPKRAMEPMDIAEVRAITIYTAVCTRRRACSQEVHEWDWLSLYTTRNEMDYLDCFYPSAVPKVTIAARMLN